mgnify:FL=1
MEYLKKVCPCCNNIFETTKSNKVYCDSVCKNRYAPKLRETAEAKYKNFVQYNIENNIEPLAGDIVRLSNDYNGIKKNTLGVIIGAIAEKSEKYEIVFNTTLPAYIFLDKTVFCKGGSTILLETKNLIHAKKTNMLYCYPDRKKADDLFLVNEYKTIL